MLPEEGEAVEAEERHLWSKQASDTKHRMETTIKEAGEVGGGSGRKT